MEWTTRWIIRYIQENQARETVDQRRENSGKHGDRPHNKIQCFELEAMEYVPADGMWVQSEEDWEPDNVWEDWELDSGYAFS